MRRKVWIKDCHGKYFGYFRPLGVGVELRLAAALHQIPLTLESLPQIITLAASIVLDLPPEVIEMNFDGDTLLRFWEGIKEDLSTEIVIPKRKRKKPRRAKKKTISKAKGESVSFEESIFRLITFLLYYSSMTLEEVLCRPKQELVDIYVHLLDLIEQEMDFELQISAVSALSAFSGGGKNAPEEGIFDLTTEEGISSLTSVPGLVEVVNG